MERPKHSGILMCTNEDLCSNTDIQNTHNDEQIHVYEAALDRVKMTLEIS